MTNGSRGESAPGAEAGDLAAGGHASTTGKVVALIAMLVLYFFAFFQRAGIPGTIFNELQQDFRMSAFAVAGLGAAFFYVYAGMQVVVGMAADRYGGGRALLFGSAFMCAGALLFPLTHSVVALYASRLLIGFGSSFIFLSIVKEIDVLFAPRHFANLMGVVLMVSYAGSIAATLPFERAAHAFGWRDSLMGVGILTGVALVVAWVVLRRVNHAVPQPTGTPMRYLWDAARNTRSRGLLVCALINFPVVFAIQGVLGKKFLEDSAGLSSAGAATFVLVMAFTAGLAGLCGGPALRLTGQRRRPLLIGGAAAILAPSLLMLFGVLLDAPGWLFLVAYMLLALSTIASPASVATMKELNRPGAVAVAISVLNAVVYIGVAVLGNVAGAVLDLFRSRAQVTETGIIYPVAAYATFFGVLSALGLVSLLAAMFFVPETRGRALTIEEMEQALT